MNPTQTIEKLASGSALSQREAYEMQSAILRGEVQTSALFEYFSALGARPPTSEELRGFFKASLEAMTPLTTDIDTLDTCGTGGDGSGSFNISTAAAILCAATGVSVTKHGNRAASSTCGSADVLEALGVKIELSPIAAKRVLTKCGFVFLFARSYHPAFRHAAEARKAYGI
jgi:anthranilate phosphoribosyltransferase